jgi:hypothetical protein
MTPPSAAEWEKHLEVCCPCCLEVIESSEPRAEIFWLGAWTVAHVECEKKHSELMEEDV